MSLYVMITAANGGIGYATCQRLIANFVSSTLTTSQLHILFTTRSARKSAEALKSLRSWASHHDPQAASSRIHLATRVVHLDSLLSVYEFAEDLCNRPISEDLKGPHQWPRVDVLICNAGITGQSGIDWLRAAWSIPLSYKDQFTWPNFQHFHTGLTAPRQTRRLEATAAAEKEDDEKHALPQQPALGEVFTANVFGHYVLAHHLMPLLRRTAEGENVDGHQQGRIVWLGSLNARPDHFDLDDPQCLTREVAYSSSKRLIDLLVLSSRLLGPQNSILKHFYAVPSEKTPQAKSGDSAPKQYLAHPAIAATNATGLSREGPAYLVHLLYLVAMLLARWVGSPWHVIDPYKGAVAPVWLALADQQTLDELENDGEGVKEEGPKTGKWGSAVDRLGREQVVRTDVEGWGLDGTIAPAEGKILSRARQQALGRAPGSKVVTKESREQLEDDGRRAWQYMERLREEWEERLSLK